MSQYCYTSVNHPESFDFHDSVFRLGRVGDTEIAVCVQALNISKAAEQNPYECDMEIQTAHIVFRGVSEFVYDPGRVWERDAEGNFAPVGPKILFRGKEAYSRFEDDLSEGAMIICHSIVEADHFEIDGTGKGPYFFVSFKAEEVVIEWDDYRGPAWYEKRDL